MAKTNFLEETLEVLKEKGYKLEEALYIGDKNFKFTPGQFKLYANFEYDDGFGGHIIPLRLRIQYKNVIFFREEYDGSESWELFNISIPKTKQADDNQVKLWHEQIKQIAQEDLDRRDKKC